MRFISSRKTFSMRRNRFSGYFSEGLREARGQGEGRLKHDGGDELLAGLRGKAIKQYVTKLGVLGSMVFCRCSSFSYVLLALKSSMYFLSIP
jgi:hypothetical protein